MQFDSLRQRREAFGFDVEDISEAAGLSGARIHAIEAGSEPVYLDELTRLARALAFDAGEWVNGADLDDPRHAVARFRADAGGQLAPIDLRLMARAAQLAREGEALRLMLGQPESTVEKLRRVKPVSRGRVRPHEQGYRLGEAARLALAPGRQPLVSVQGLLESCGVHVALVAFASPAVDAVSLYEPAALPMILLNTRKDRVRHVIPRRATLSHELCHLLHDARGPRDLLTLVSWSGSKAPEEQRANGFAPAFLAPPKWLAGVDGEPEARVRMVGERWGLSAEGAVWHCKNAKLIEADVAEHLNRRGNRPMVKRDRALEPPLDRASDGLRPPADVSTLCRGLISDCVFDALDGDHISQARARELLAWR